MYMVMWSGFQMDGRRVDVGVLGVGFCAVRPSARGIELGSLEDDVAVVREEDHEALQRNSGEALDLCVDLGSVRVGLHVQRADAGEPGEGLGLHVSLERCGELRAGGCENLCPRSRTQYQRIAEHGDVGVRGP
jgi:hypothetical protein